MCMHEKEGRLFFGMKGLMHSPSRTWQIVTSRHSGVSLSAVLTAASQHLGPTLVLGCQEEMPQKGGLSEGAAFSWIKAVVASCTTKML